MIRNIHEGFFKKISSKAVISIRTPVVLAVLMTTMSSWGASIFWSTNVPLTQTKYVAGDVVKFTTRIRKKAGSGVYNVEALVTSSTTGQVVGNRVYSNQTLSDSVTNIYSDFSYAVPATANGQYVYKIKVFEGTTSLPLDQVGLAFTVTAPDSGAFNWIKGFNTTAAPNMVRPQLNVPYKDPVFGLQITRVTTASQVTDRDFPSWLRHEYSRRPAFNADSTRAIMASSNGWMRLMAVDKATNKMTFIKTLSIAESQEPNWHPMDPNIIRIIPSYGVGMTITEYNITNDAKVVKASLLARVKSKFPSATALTTGQEGRPSNDGNIWCFIAKNGDSVYGLVSYNLQTDQVLGTYATTAKPDHISTSPLGKYCVPSWAFQPTLGTRAFSLDFSTSRMMLTQSEHSDLALTKEGKEVYVFSDYGSGDVAMVELATGVRTNLFRLYGSKGSAVAMHFSGIGTQKKPGYVLISFYACHYSAGGACTAGDQWFDNKTILSELKASPQIYNLAHNRNAGGDYWGSPTAVSNNDFSLALFASMWESTNMQNLSDYMIKIPASSLP